MLLRQRLEQRAATFLATARRGIFARPGRPYARLFALAGCEYGDLERLVRHDGLEAALAELFRRGVYLAVDEMKGRRPVRRGSASFELRPEELRNPLVGGDVPHSTGGSRGARTKVPVVLDFLRDRAVDQIVEFDARGGLGWRHALWTVPGSLAPVWILWHTAAGVRIDRWFSQFDPRRDRLPARHVWAQRLLRLAGLLSGVELPRPTAAPIDDPLAAARWMAGCLLRGQTPHLWTFASSAVRLCRAAGAAGLGLEGARFTVSGEPLTSARAAEITRVGARVVSAYGTAEVYAIATSCLTPRVTDDMHVYADMVALIQPGGDRALPGFPARALFVTPLRPTAPMLFVNASLGDQGTLDERACDCALYHAGWTHHLHGVSSFEKLTAGGITFLDVDAARILDGALPARFGGGPTDYQLLEEEGPDGQPRLSLLVNPAVGPLDAGEVADAFLGELARLGDGEQIAQLQWRRAGWLEVRRERPNVTETGKILHLHSRRP